MARKRRQETEVIKDVDFSAVKKESERPKCFDSKCNFCKKEICEEYFDDCKPDNSDSLF